MNLRICCRILAVYWMVASGYASSEPPQSSGRTAWAENAVGRAIRGLDGALYDPYNRQTIERTQQALRTRGLYSGPISGILDVPTMRAIYEFQKASYVLQMCGVPTPRTRMMLEQGSHTDPETRGR